MRKPFQGVWNIIRFNWQFYASAIVLIVVLLLFRNNFNETLRAALVILASIVSGSTLTSLVVSYYIYDLSSLYNLSWLDEVAVEDNGRILNIHAGFDETSCLLKRKFVNSYLVAFDFYDPEKHTEISIKRARKVYSPFPNTQQVKTTHLPLGDNSIENVFLLLAAHEIRNDEERRSFFFGTSQSAFGNRKNNRHGAFARYC